MSETIGIAGYAAAGILGEVPHLVGYRRDRGYPWPPFSPMPERFLPGASSVGKCVGDSWDWWARRVAARTAAKMGADIAVMRNARDAERVIYAEAQREQWKPAEDGSLVHDFTAHLDAGRQPKHDLPDRLAGHVKAWEAFKRDYAVRCVAIERTIYAPSFSSGVGGTADRIVTLGGTSDLVLIDLKSKISQPLSKITPSVEHLIQAVALSQSRYLAIEEHQTTLPLPAISQAGIVYVARDGYHVQWIWPHHTDLLNLTAACIAARAGRDRLGTGAWGTPAVRHLANNGAKLVDVPSELQPVYTARQEDAMKQPDDPFSGLDDDE